MKVVTHAAGYDQYPVGTLVRLKPMGHLYEGRAMQDDDLMPGDIGTVVTPASTHRTFRTPHVVARFQHSSGMKRQWYDTTCLELYENGPSEEEIASLFGTKTDAELLTGIIAKEVGQALSAGVIDALAQAIVASPVWRHA